MLRANHCSKKCCLRSHLGIKKTALVLFFLWYHSGSNQGHTDFQSVALPTELWYPHQLRIDGAKLSISTKLRETFLSNRQIFYKEHLSIQNQQYNDTLSCPFCTPIPEESSRYFYTLLIYLLLIKVNIFHNPLMQT